jgi:hypothetical protein
VLLQQSISGGGCVKVGDLVKVADSACEGGHGCGCWFCFHQSSRIGVVLKHLNKKVVKHSKGYWSVMFDVGEWRLYGSEMEIINES